MLWERSSRRVARTTVATQSPVLSVWADLQGLTMRAAL